MSTIYIIDDHAIFGKGLKYLLTSHKIADNVKVFTKYQDFMESILEKLPDLVLADQVLNAKSGIEILVGIKEKYPQVKCVLISSSKDLSLLDICSQKKMEGYIFKSEPESVTLNAIGAVLRGETFFSKFKTLNSQIKKSSFSLNPFHSLTQQELEVVRYLAKGCTHKEISAHLNIALKTVNVHRNNIAQKMNKLPTAKIIHEAFLWGVLKDEDLLG